MSYDGTHLPPRGPPGPPSGFSVPHQGYQVRYSHNGWVPYHHPPPPPAQPWAWQDHQVPVEALEGLEVVVAPPPSAPPSPPPPVAPTRPLPQFLPEPPVPSGLTDRPILVGEHQPLTSARAKELLVAMTSYTNTVTSFYDMQPGEVFLYAAATDAEGANWRRGSKLR